MDDLRCSILSSSGNFPGIKYNENKVSKGVAELVAMPNLEMFSDEKLTIEQKQEILKEWCSTNDRIQNKQFHVSISAKSTTATKEELLQVAMKYLDYMGYGNNPAFIYFHNDTKNNHIHIVSARVDSNGKKIDDSFEAVKGHKFIQQLLGHNIEQETKDKIDQAVNTALTYDIQSVKQFMSILQSMGIKCKEDKDKQLLNLYRLHHTQKEINFKEIEKRIEESKQNSAIREARLRQLKAIFQKYQGTFSTREEMSDFYRKNFGVELVFFMKGNNKTPYGYTIIDHKEKIVYKGSEIMKLSQLLEMNNKKESFDMNKYIEKLFQRKKLMNTYQLDKQLRHDLTGVREGKIIVRGGKAWEISDSNWQRLLYNTRISQIYRFRPSTKQQAELLSQFYNVDVKDVKIHNKGKEQKDVFHNIVIALMKKNKEKAIQELRSRNTYIWQKDGHIYAIDNKFCQITEISKDEWEQLKTDNWENDIKQAKEAAEKEEFENHDYVYTKENQEDDLDYELFDEYEEEVSYNNAPSQGSSLHVDVAGVILGLGSGDSQGQNTSTSLKKKKKRK